MGKGSTDTKKEEKFLERRPVRFLIGIGGIYFAFMLCGVMQEALFLKNYSKTEGTIVKFSHPWALLFWQCLFSTIVAFIMNLKEKTQMTVGIRDQMEVGFFNTFSMLGAGTALQYMSYPLQSLFKSCKVLSILIVGLVFGKTNYPVKQYITGAVVTLGIIGFNMFEVINTLFSQNRSYPPSLKPAKTSKETQVIGLILIAGSLFSDGMLAEKQQIMRKKFNPTSFQLMELCSKWCVLFSLICAIVMNQLVSYIQFCIEYPSSLVDVFTIGFLACFGQIFIFYTLRNFGAVVLALVTTTRKFFTVLFSIIYFQHSIEWMQWVCIALILAGVSVEMHESLTGKKENHAEKPVENELPQSSKDSKKKTK